MTFNFGDRQLMPKILIAGGEHELADVTVGLVETMQNALVADGASAVARMLNVINAALAPGERHIDRETPAKFGEIRSAFREVLLNAGFRDIDEVAAGN